MDFEIKKFDAGGRLGIIRHNDKKMPTPNLFPVVSPFENIIPPQEIIDVFKGNAVFSNAYILYKKPDQAANAKMKGIHRFIKFNGLIATDSGAFQHYMYGGEGDITSREIEIFQEQIGSDFAVILDLPVQLEDTREIAEYKVLETIKRAKENISRRTTEKCAWFGPIHGGKYIDLLKKSSKEMSELDFGFYAIGGLVKIFNDYMFDISTNIFLKVRQFLKLDRPIHLFGAGLPQFFSLSVACGVDTMDSAAYVLFAKQGRYFTLTGTKNIINLTELPCNCPICSEYTINEIKDLYKMDIKKNKNMNRGEMKGIGLIARHNLYISFGELKTIREAIRDGTLWNLVEQRVHAHPKLIKAYKQLPKYWPQLEIMESVEKPKATFILGEISNSRPIFYRIIKKIFQNYSIAKKRDLILLPELDSSIFNSLTMKKWINKIESINVELNRIGNHENIHETIIISNLFGPIPYTIIKIYPLVQREWIYNYRRTNWELYSLLKYQKLNPNEFFSNNEDKIQQSNSFMDILLGINNNKDILEFGESRYNLNEQIEFGDIINRIEICIQFFKKHKDKIKNLTIIRPESYISEEGYEYTLKTHLIDDIIQILKKNQDILNKDTTIKKISSLEEIDKYIF